MDLTTSFETCACGRTFNQPNAFSHHRRTCKKSKSRLSSALSLAQEVYSRQKKHRVDTSESMTNRDLLTGYTAVVGSSSTPIEGLSAQNNPALREVHDNFELEQTMVMFPLDSSV